MKPAFRPAPVCKFRLRDAGATSGSASRFQEFAVDVGWPLDKKEQSRNITMLQPQRQPLAERIRPMIAALGTLVFLTTLWLFAVMGAAILEESGAKIAAALNGESVHCQPTARMRLRRRPPIRTIMREREPWRAAA
jgi:hypothetical protein